MSQTTYQVVLSTDGKHSVIATTDNQADTRLALAWAKATYEQLVNLSGLKGEQGQGNDEQQDGSVPECAIHHVPMVLVQGKQGPFWSCHKKNQDGSWCSYKPKIL